MIQLRKINYAIGDLNLLEEIDWSINDGAKIALIGPNGAGKTTLLRIITSELQPVSGDIIKPKDFTIGYLPQEEVSIESGRILDRVIEGQHRLVAIERQIKKLHMQLEVGEKSHDEAVISQLAHLEERYRLGGGYQLESKARSILSGLGFDQSDYGRNVSELSGGWRMRVYLARLLLQSPDLLLLDEPTNHLDIPSLEWLEKFIANFPGSVVIVSHDRFFVDRLSEEICELEDGKLTRYVGNYHDYERQKEQARELLTKRWEALQGEKERQQRFIDRFRYKASKASQVQSRIKMLEKLETIDISQRNYDLDFSIKVEMPSYKHVLTIENMYFKYESNWVLEGVNLDVYRGEKVALVGVNGAGKTTLTKLISGQLIPQQGTVRLGEKVKYGYYAQHQIDSLNLRNSIYEEVATVTADSNIPKIRPALGIFQFTGDEVYKRIEVLSGGEKARVSLAKILLSPVNFLIMDEPTNHLDIYSKEALENALAAYDGTLIIISHDRYFLDKIVDRVVEIVDGRIYEYWGNYSDYLSRREERESASDTIDSSSEETSMKKKTKDQKRQEAEARQRVSKQRKQIQEEIARLEQEIDQLETRQHSIEHDMTLPETYQNGELIAGLRKEYASLAERIERCYADWGDYQQSLEKLLSELSQDKP
ncbi:ATP-binding cassette domain-containing protein [candidate division KSB1 bacterium]|nr:ATP-binding cassette domain-containing protein [candidate division KSB1 bacterium]